MIDTLAARNIAFYRGKRSVLDNVSLSVSGGQMLALLGTNGAGKSTLLKILLRLLRPANGNIHLNDRDISMLTQREIARHIAYVPQGHVAAFPYSVEEIVCMGRLPQAAFGTKISREDIEAAYEALETLSVGRLAKRRYNELSGGERQSVLLARALTQGARILILDEPETGLDFGQQERLYDVLTSLVGTGYAVLATTHDPLRAREVFSHAALLKDGTIYGYGAVSDVLTDAGIAKLYGLRPRMRPDTSQHHSVLYT